MMATPKSVNRVPILFLSNPLTTVPYAEIKYNNGNTGKKKSIIGIGSEQIVSPVINQPIIPAAIAGRKT